MAIRDTRWRSVLFVYSCSYALVTGLILGHPDGLTMYAPLVLIVAPSGYLVWRTLRIDRTAYIGLLAHNLLVALAALASTYFAGPAWPWSVALALLSTLVGVASLHPDARHAFLSGDIRGMRRHPRYQVAVRALVTTGKKRVAMETYDLSEGGAYLTGGVEGFALRSRISVELVTREGASLWLSARVVSVNPEGLGTKPPGVGVKFSSDGKHESQSLREITASARRHKRYLVSLPLQLHSRFGVTTTTTVDMSEGGCLIAQLPPGLSPGDTVMAHVELHEGECLELLAQIVWRSDADAHTSGGAALRFMSLAATDTEAIRARLCASDVAVDMGIAA